MRVTLNGCESWKTEITRKPIMVLAIVIRFDVKREMTVTFCQLCTLFRYKAAHISVPKPLLHIDKTTAAEHNNARNVLVGNQ